MIDWLYGVFGNFGVAIIVFTIFIKVLFFPLANKSYRSMSKMKLLGPKMTALREQYKDDPAKLQQQMMAMYKAEKVNPASGCLPMVIQIPVFFSLYKVIFTTIDPGQPRAPQLALADHVRPGAALRHQPQHRQVVVRLHRIMHPRQPAHGRGQGGQPAAHGAGRVHPGRGAEHLGDARQRHAFEHQPVHGVHGKLRPGREQGGDGGFVLEDDGCGSGHGAMLRPPRPAFQHDGAAIPPWGRRAARA